MRMPRCISSLILRCQAQALADKLGRPNLQPLKQVKLRNQARADLPIFNPWFAKLFTYRHWGLNELKFHLQEVSIVQRKSPSRDERSAITTTDHVFLIWLSATALLCREDCSSGNGG